jgi:diguanylate cyclase (GGDEF)-like protein
MDRVTLPDLKTEQRTREIRSGIRKISRQNWSLWTLAIIIILALTTVVITFSLQVIDERYDPFYKFHINQSVRGLVGLVLLFSCYTLYQQIQLRRTRRRLDEEIEVSAQQQMLAEEYLRLAMLDPLTGLHNRRYAQERLISEIARAQRLGTSLTVLMIDVDGLKAINDRHGHAAGDMVLKTFGERLSRAIRGSDLAVRIGGDEFVVLLPECAVDEVEHVLSRLTLLEVTVEAQKVAFYFSSGSANYRPGESPDQLLERADHTLYAEKDAKKKQLQPLA